jgi:Amt family ammonium transporter
MLEAGCVRYKNVNSIIIKVVINTVYTVIIFWLLGFGFAFGADAGEFIGTDRFAGAGFES